MNDSDQPIWNARYLDRGGRIDDRCPDPFLVAVADRLPGPGRILDVAGGDGRNAIWLARRGWEATVADFAPEALRLARARADLVGVSIATVEVDLEGDPFPPGPWDLIVCVAYLHRPLFRAFAANLVPGGRLVVVHPTIRNLERFARPGMRFLLAEGELLRLLHGWDILHAEEGWRPGPTGRHEARCLARRPADVSPGNVPP